MPGFKIYFEFLNFFNFIFFNLGIPFKTKINHRSCSYEKGFVSWNFVLPIYKYSFRLTCKPYWTFCQISTVECVIHNSIADVLKSGWKKWIANAASRSTLVPFERYGRSKKCAQKTLFPYLFPLKTIWNIVREYSKTNSCPRYTNIFPQMCWTTNIFGPSATTIGGLGLSVNYPILNFKKMVCPKKVWIQHR